MCTWSARARIERRPSWVRASTICRSSSSSAGATTICPGRVVPTTASSDILLLARTHWLAVRLANLQALATNGQKYDDEASVRLPAGGPMSTVEERLLPSAEPVRLIDEHGAAHAHASYELPSAETLTDGYAQ